jgi:hypothetical protein
MKNLLITAVTIFGFATITMAQVPSYVPTNGLVGWWPFNGNANDESGNGNDGTVTGPTLTTDRFGVANRAYYISQATSIIDFGNSQSFGLTNNNVKTFSFWFKGINSSTIYSIYKYENWNGANSNYGIMGGANVIATTANGTGPNTVANNLTPNVWTHCVCIIQAGTNNSKIYINGILVSSGTSNLASTISSANLKVNSALGGQNYTTGIGYFDDFAIWNRALTSCEIQDLYASQLNSTFVNAGTDQSICNGNPVTLSAMNSLNYSWDNGVADGVAFNPTATQDYTVSADSAGCLSTDVVTVTVNEHTTATQTETALDSYTWPINSQTYTQSGTYTAIIPNAAGCDSTITLNLSLDFTGINEISQENLFTVFPNPAQSQINVKADSKLIGAGYSIYDNTGRIVLTGKLNAQNTTIELNNLSGGIYLFSVGENMKQSFKVIKE